MERLTNLEREILTKALHNQTFETRRIPHWRPAVKCPLYTTVNEVAGDELSPWCRERFSQNTDIPARLLFQAQHLFGSDIVPGRTNHVSPETWEKIGYVFAAGKVFHVRSEAEKQAKVWQKKAPWLEIFVLPELDLYADLFMAEVVGGTGGTHLMHKNRPMVADPGADTKEIEAVFKKLETRGLAVCVEGQEAACKWAGIQVTQKGADLLRKKPEVPPVEVKADGPRLKCLGCNGIFHHTTDKFNPDVAPNGGMFRLMDKFKKQGWEPWPTDWTGDNLICPKCGERVVDPHTGLLPDGALVDAKP